MCPMTRLSYCTISLRMRFLFAAFILTLLTGSSSWAVPITAAQAQLAVQHWLALDPAPLETALSQQLAGVTPYGNASSPLYYAVALSPSGFVLVAGDDRLEPIIAFAPRGVYDPATTTPLGALVSRDLPNRLAQAQALASVASPPAGCKMPSRARNKSGRRCSVRTARCWRQAPPRSTIRASIRSRTTWSQATANEDGKTACYNYYTPPYSTPGNPNNDVCGCVATAMAQLMRYWQYPTTGVGTDSFPITIDGSSATGQLRGGDGAGGPYLWANMPLSPTTGTPKTQCQAIGALCSDAGVAVDMEYPPTAPAPMTATYYLRSPPSFSTAMRAIAYADEEDITADVPGIVNPNLDAGFPVSLAFKA